MGVYRVEASPNARAGCHATECKKEAVKIAKGEFRYAIQVTIQEHQSWQYRHWGCVTPKQIENLIETCGGDTEMVDGYDELPAEFQEKIQFALENGHVPDEDWKYDVEKNRPGQSGFRLTKADLKKMEKDAAEDDEEDGEKPKKKRARKVKNEDDEEEKKAPAPKKRVRPVKKEKVDDEEEEEAPASKKRARVSKKEDINNDDDASASKQTRARRGKKVEYKEDEDEDEAPPAKKARGKPKKAVPKVISDVEKHSETEEEEVPKPKRGKKAVAADGEAKVPQKRSRKKAFAQGE